MRRPSVVLLFLIGILVLPTSRALSQDTSTVFKPAIDSVIGPALERENSKVRRNEILGFVHVNTSLFTPGAGVQRQFVFNIDEAIKPKVKVPGVGHFRTVLTRETAAPAINGQTNWVGTVEGIEDSSVSFVYDRSKTLLGTIRLPDAVFRIRKSANDLYVVEKVVPRDFPNEAEPQKLPREGALRKHDAPDAQQCEDDNATRTLRVLVLYSDAAQKNAGSPAELNLAIGDIVGEANLALKNSKIRARLTVVGIEKAVIKPSEISKDYRANLSGNIGVQKRREATKAHLVTLLDAFPDSYDYCGVGYILGDDLNFSKQNNGYTVVDFKCAWDNLSLIHEIGHNLGAGHGREDHGHGLYNYSGGMKWPDKFRSIMAYKCNSPASCTRIPRFTNPRIRFSNVAIGDRETADNAKTLNRTRCSVAKWF